MAKNVTKPIAEESTTPVVQKKTRTNFWKNEKVVKYFKYLCEQSSVSSVDWKKFRNKDTKGIFSKINNTHLAAMASRFRNPSDKRTATW